MYGFYMFINNYDYIVVVDDSTFSELCKFEQLNLIIEGADDVYEKNNK